jgi:hypothetical protein
MERDFLGEDWEEDEMDNDSFDDIDMVKNHYLPLTKEQVLKAFNELNTSGKNWILTKIKSV